MLNRKQLMIHDFIEDYIVYAYDGTGVNFSDCIRISNMVFLGNIINQMYPKCQYRYPMTHMHYVYQMLQDSKERKGIKKAMERHEVKKMFEDIEHETRRVIEMRYEIEGKKKKKIEGRRGLKS